MVTPRDVHSANILVVDDTVANTELLERALSGDGYESVTSTNDPFEVCSLHRVHRYDLIILDLVMPGLDGFQVMEGLNSIEVGGYLPVLAMTAHPGHKLRALQAGAKDFISTPFELVEVQARVYNMLEVSLLLKNLHRSNEVLEQRVQQRTAELQDNYLETIFTMTRAAEYKDEDTGVHVKRISYYCRELARMLGLAGDFVDRMFFGSPMHDIGKIGIPDHILLKPGSLTPAEYEIMKGHASMGAQILANSKSPYLTMGAEIALNHHERWDGGGYPMGKRAEEIPMSARIMNICDIYDALRGKRPYKPALDHPTAMDIIAHGDGRTQPGHFDPAIHAMFTHNHQTFRDTFAAHTA